VTLFVLGYEIREQEKNGKFLIEIFGDFVI